MRKQQFFFEDLYLKKKLHLCFACAAVFMHRQWHPRSSYLKKARQLVCSYLCTPCMLINPSVYLLLAFLFFVFSGMRPMVLALICSMLFTFRSVPGWLSQFSSFLCLSGAEPSISVSAPYVHIQRDLKQVTHSVTTEHLCTFLLRDTEAKTRC